MTIQTEHRTNTTNQVLSVIGSLLIGTLVGAAAMLLYAPQSGEKTRDQIRQKNIEIRNMTTEAIEDAMANTRQKAQKIQGIVQNQVNSLNQGGQDVMEVLDQ
jgi:gas vesicle protein